MYAKETSCNALTIQFIEINKLLEKEQFWLEWIVAVRLQQLAFKIPKKAIIGKFYFIFKSFKGTLNMQYCDDH